MSTSKSAFSLSGAIWVLFLTILVTVSAEDQCETNFKSNLDELIKVTVGDKEKLNLKSFKIALTEGEDFNNILTPECPKDNFPKLSVEFRAEGTEDWSEYEIDGIIRERRNQQKLIRGRKEGKIRLKDEELDYCKVYEMKLKVNDDTYAEEVIKFGPLKESFTEEELIALNEDNADSDENTKKLDFTYAELKNEVRVSWNYICAESIKIYLTIAGGTSKVFKTETSLSTTNFNSSVTIPTKPCTQYDLELETYLSSDPRQKTHEYGALHTGNNEFITSPNPETFGNIKMEKESKKLSWDFREYLGFLSNENAICINRNNLTYKITFGTIEGEELFVLTESEKPITNKEMTLDVLSEIEYNKKTKALEKCHSYEVKMEVSYKTISGKELKRLFTEPFQTNHDGTFEEKAGDINLMTRSNDTLNIKFGSCGNTGEVLLVDMGNSSTIGKGRTISQPRIVNTKQATKVNTKFSIPELITEELEPCVSYTIQLVTQEQKDQLLKTILENNQVSNLADAIQLDTIEPWGKPTLTLEGITLKVEDAEKNNRCSIETYKIKCWDTAENETSAEEDIYPKANINILELNFTVASEHTCRARIEYQAQGGDQSKFQTEWSEVLVFTAPDPTTVTSAPEPTSAVNEPEIITDKKPELQGSNEDSIKSEASPVGAIVGVVVVIIVLALAGVAFFMYRKKKATTGGTEQDPNLSYRASTTKSSATVEMGPSPLADSEIKPEENQTKGATAATEVTETPPVVTTLAPALASEVASPAPDVSSTAPDVSSTAPDVSYPAPDVSSPAPDVSSPVPDISPPAP